MPPALVLVGFGRERRIVLPFPFFLLWPFLLLGWVFLGAAWLVFSRRPRSGRLMTGLVVLRALTELRGTQVDFRGEDGSLFLKFI